MKGFKDGGKTQMAVYWRVYEVCLRCSGSFVEEGSMCLLAPWFLPSLSIETSSHFYLLKKHFVLPLALALSWAYLKKKTTHHTRAKRKKDSTHSSGGQGQVRGEGTASPAHLLGFERPCHHFVLISYQSRRYRGRWAQQGIESHRWDSVTLLVTQFPALGEVSLYFRVSGLCPFWAVR